MDIARQIVEVGRAVRKTTNIRVRQPLPRALIGTPGGGELPAELLAEIADELNVREVTQLAQAGEVVDVVVKPNFRTLGKRYGSRTQQVANAITDADHSELVRNLKADSHATVSLDGEDIALTVDEVILTEVPRSGWAVISQQGVTVALDTTITPELRKAGLAREVIRLVQTARKEADLEVTDRIILSWAANSETADALRKHKRELADAVLAVEITEYPLGDIPAEANTSGTGVRRDDELGVCFWLVKA
jgi:isoleucyl-tRNA synthetase